MATESALPESAKCLRATAHKMSVSTAKAARGFAAGALAVCSALVALQLGAADFGKHDFAAVVGFGAAAIAIVWRSDAALPAILCFALLMPRSWQRAVELQAAGGAPLGTFLSAGDILVALAVWRVSRMKAESRRQIPWTAALGLGVLGVGVATGFLAGWLRNPDHAPSLVSGPLLYARLCAVCYIAASTRPRTIYWDSAFGLAAFAFLSASALELLRGAPQEYYGGRAPSLGIFISGTGMISASIAVYCWTRVLTELRQSRLLLLGILGTCAVVSLYLSGVRSSLLAWALTVLVMALAVKGRATRRAALLLLLIGTLCAGYGLSRHRGLPAEVAYRMRLGIRRGVEDTLYTRIRAWQLGVAALREEPTLVVSGRGSRESQYIYLDAPALAHSLTGSHNTYLETLIEHGMLGLSGILLLGPVQIVRCLRVLRRRQRQRADGETSVAWTAVALCQALQMLGGLAWSWYKIHVLYAVAIGELNFGVVSRVLDSSATGRACAGGKQVQDSRALGLTS